MPIGNDTRARTFRLFLHHSTKMAINIPLFTTVYKATTVRRATHYGQDGPGIGSRWRRDFPHQAFPRVKRPGRDADNPLSSSTDVKERVEPYVYSLSGPLGPVQGWTLHFTKPRNRIIIGRMMFQPRLSYKLGWSDALPPQQLLCPARQNCNWSTCEGVIITCNF
jgi:hypothetical protein